MPNETPVQASQEATQQGSGTEQSAVDYKAQFEAQKAEYDGYKKQAEGWKTTSDNAISYFNSDPVGASRVQKWMKGDPFDDAQAQPKPAEDKAPKFDPKAYEQEILSKAERMFEERSAPLRDF